MQRISMNECKCPRCLQPEDNEEKVLHYQLNLLLSRLDEQQRRWLVAYESKRTGHGGIKFMSLVTGMSVPTIRRGCRELDADLAGRPLGRPRLSGQGRPRKLTDRQLQKLEVLLLQGATAHGWRNNSWTAARVAEVIKSHFGIEFYPPYVRKILKNQLGWTYQKPVQQRGERDDKEIAKWKTIKFGRIRKAASNRNAHLVFVDESGFMLAPLRRRTYAPCGHTPVNKVMDPHARISVISAITFDLQHKRAELIFRLLPDNVNFNGSTVVDFLHQLKGHSSNRMTIIWDQIPIHSCKAVVRYLVANPDLIAEQFPPYAPELNPVDRVWAYLKYGRLANYTPADLVELRDTVTSEAARLQKRSDLLQAFIRGTGLDVAL